MAKINPLKAIFDRPQELAVALGVMVVMTVMVMPIPPFVLDILLSFSLTFAIRMGAEYYPHRH